MAIQGHFSTVTIPELFSFLYQLRKTGTLCIVSENEERSFVFEQGNLVYATTKDRSRRLGNFLVRLGVLDSDEISRTAEHTTAADGYLGEALVEADKISREELSNAVRAQMLDILEDVLAWPEGAFHFDENELPFQMPRGTHVQTQSLLFEVTSKTDERHGAKELFPDGNLILEAEPAGSHDLTPEQEDVLALVDGKTTIEQILFRSTQSIMSTATALRQLQVDGAIRTSGIRLEPDGETPTPELRCLPVAPEIPGRILAAFSHSTPSRELLLDVVARDPMLAAKLLKSLRASNVEVPRSILKIDYLIEVLGPFQLRSLLIPEAVRGLFFPSPECVWTDIREHSILCARLSEDIARAIDYPFPSEAYLAGLLHDLGAYILMSQNPQKYGEVVAQLARGDAPVESVEEDLLGISHTRIGGIYAEKWNFPRGIVAAIKNHHRVDDKAANPLLHIVAAASAGARECGVGLADPSSPDDRLDTSLKHLNLDRQRIRALVDGARGSSLRQLPVLVPERGVPERTGER